MIKSGIYCIRNKANDKRYIGMSVNIERRQRYHLNMLLDGTHYNTHLQRSFNRYDKENFEFTITESINEKQIQKRERYWIKFFDTTNSNKGYNLTDGGKGGDTFTDNPNKEEIRKKWKKPHSEEWSKNIGLKHKGVPETATARRNMSIGAIDKLFSEEHRENIGKANRGKIKLYNAVLNKHVMVNPHNIKKYLYLGYIIGVKPMSLETRNKLSKNSTGRFWMHNIEIADENFVKPEKISEYLLNGWLEGRLPGKKRPNRKTKKI